MEIFLWRHADALPGATRGFNGTSDFERELSPRGHQQARKAADWLRENAPADLRLLVSPAARTRQTAAHFCKVENNIQLCMPLYENASAKEILAILGWPDITLPVLIVGHQPQIGMFADYLLGGSTRSRSTPHPSSFRKSAIWWVRLPDVPHLPDTPLEAQLVQVVEPS